MCVRHRYRDHVRTKRDSLRNAVGHGIEMHSITSLHPRAAGMIPFEEAT